MILRESGPALIRNPMCLWFSGGGGGGGGSGHPVSPSGSAHGGIGAILTPWILHVGYSYHCYRERYFNALNYDQVTGARDVDQGHQNIVHVLHLQRKTVPFILSQQSLCNDQSNNTMPQGMVTLIYPTPYSMLALLSGEYCPSGFIFSTRYIF